MVDYVGIGHHIRQAIEFVSVPRIVHNRAQLIGRIMEIAERNNDVILYAD